MEKDRNDYEYVQSEWEGSDETVLAAQRDYEQLAELEADLESQDEIREAQRYGVFDLKYATKCARCHRLLPVGTRVVGRKLDGAWLIEELACA